MWELRLVLLTMSPAELSPITFLTPIPSEAAKTEGSHSPPTTRMLVFLTEYTAYFTCLHTGMCVYVRVCVCVYVFANIQCISHVHIQVSNVSLTG